MSETVPEPSGPPSEMCRPNPDDRRQVPGSGVVPVPVEPPAPGAARELADGVLWLRMPLPLAKLSHVNLYALDDRLGGGAGWTLVDTGLAWRQGRAALEAARAGPLSGAPIARVILTHHHPDHIGLAGDLAREGAEILATRTAWTLGRMLALDIQDRPSPEQIAFRRSAGLTETELAAYAGERPFNFADCVAPIPLGFSALEEGAQIVAGGRTWRVRLGQGHAPDHATLWSEDGTLVLAGDQVLEAISPNIGVYPTEPDADPLGGYLDSCRRFAALATLSAPGGAAAGPLVLAGHQRPFRGLARRLGVLIDDHEAALARIEAALADRPATAVELFSAIFRREIEPSQHGLAMAEAVAHVNRLLRAGRAVRARDAAGAWRYSLAEASA